MPCETYLDSTTGVICRCWISWGSPDLKNGWGQLQQLFRKNLQVLIKKCQWICCGRCLAFAPKVKKSTKKKSKSMSMVLMVVEGKLFSMMVYMGVSLKHHKMMIHFLVGKKTMGFFGETHHFRNLRSRSQPLPPGEIRRGQDRQSVKNPGQTLQEWIDVEIFECWKI